MCTDSIDGTAETSNTGDTSTTSTASDGEKSQVPSVSTGVTSFEDEAVLESKPEGHSPNETGEPPSKSRDFLPELLAENTRRVEEFFKEHPETKDGAFVLSMKRKKRN